MLKINGLLIAATFGLMAALPQTAAAGEVKIYPYHTSVNYCPHHQRHGLLWCPEPACQLRVDEGASRGAEKGAPQGSPCRLQRARPLPRRHQRLHLRLINRRVV